MCTEPVVAELGWRPVQPPGFSDCGMGVGAAVVHSLRPSFLLRGAV